MCIRDSSQGNPVSAGQAAALLSRAEGVTRSSFAAVAIEEDLEIPPEWMPESTRKYFEGTGTGGCLLYASLSV